MKVLLLNTADQKGGAAIACFRLLLSLRKEKINAKLLTINKSSNDFSVCKLHKKWLGQKLDYFYFFWERLIIFIYNRFRSKNLFDVSLANTGTDIHNHPLVKNADIIHIHWINHGFLSIKNIQKLLETKKKVVWTFHDLWPATGICHYPQDCTRYHQHCFSCPKLFSTTYKDLSYKVYQQKQILDLDKIHIIGCSKWITEKAKASNLLKNNNFCSIPNPIDTNIFKPENKLSAKISLNLPYDKILLLFAADKISNKRKGISFLIEACNILVMKHPAMINHVEIILMGSNNMEKEKLPLTLTTHPIGYISSIKDLVKVYSAADVFIIPSLEDNLPNTIMEALACGTPCIGFNIGGIPEMIDHNVNGYVAQYKDAEDLANGISWVINYSNPQKLSNNARKKVETSYAERIVAKKYIDLYTKILS